MTTSSITLCDADEIAAFYVDMTGMQPDFLQLSAGTVDFTVDTRELAGVSIVWASARGRTFWRDTQADGTVQFGFALACDSTLRVRGRDIGPDEAMLWIPGQDMDYLMHGPIRTLEVGVEASLVAELGWEFRGEPLRVISRPLLNALVRICRLASDTAVQEDPGSVAYWRDQVLDALESVLAPWLDDPTEVITAHSRSYRHAEMLRQTNDYFERLGYSDPFDADELADSIGISRRTVFHAYRQFLGIGPRRYFELKRLHMLRRRLMRADGAQETITSIATDLGFSDLGRMAARYREHFGEYPRETLARQSAGF